MLKVIALAAEEQRVLLTEDRDFGRLVFAQGHRSAGVIYLRYPARARRWAASTVSDFVARTAELEGRFVVVQPGRVRISRVP